MIYCDLLNQLQKLSEEDLNKTVTVYDYETDTIMEDSLVGFEMPKFHVEGYGSNYPFITIN